MPHIALPNLPGILAPMNFRPEAAKALNLLAETLLRGDSTLSVGERELIATYVSLKNECLFCSQSHKAVTEETWQGDPGDINQILENPESAPITPKLRALLAIAAQVQKSGRAVTTQAVEHAKKEGATDIEIHDTVLIAAAFCMYNRYVDGLATQAPPAGSPAYREMGMMLKDKGYKNAVV